MMLPSDSEVSPNLDVFSAPILLLLQSHSAAVPLNADCLDWFSGGGGAAQLEGVNEERAAERRPVTCHFVSFPAAFGAGLRLRRPILTPISLFATCFWPEVNFLFPNVY